MTDNKPGFFKRLFGIETPVVQPPAPPEAVPDAPVPAPAPVEPTPVPQPAAEPEQVPLPGPPETTALRIRNAQLEAEINALRTILETERERAERETRRVEEIKAERDKWCAQAERLALSPPVTPQRPRRSWWSLRRAG